PAQPGILHDVFRFGDRAQHPVSDLLQSRTKPIESVCRVVHEGLRYVLVCRGENARGVTPRLRRNIVENALGLSYPRSRATWVTGWPAPSRRTAWSRQACLRHCT